MMPIDFEGSNLTLVKPSNMTDEQCASLYAYKGIDNDGFPFILTVWQPSKEDIEAVIAGRPICIKTVGETFPPMAVYTTDENLNANV